MDAEYRYSAYGVVYGEDPNVGRLSGARPRGTEYLYTGSRLDAQTRFADFGYRDYAASLARFTSIDPIRDGRNWFAYAEGDPVNQVDVWGLAADDVGLSDPTRLESFVSNVILPISVPRDFSGTVVASYYAGGSAILNLEFGAGLAAEYDEGDLVRIERVRTARLGIETNVAVEAGIGIQRLPGAAIGDVLGWSLGQELDITISPLSIGGSDEISSSDRAVQTEGVSAAAGVGAAASPLSYSAYLTETRLNESTEYRSLYERRR